MSKKISLLFASAVFLGESDKEEFILQHFDLKRKAAQVLRQQIRVDKSDVKSLAQEPVEIVYKIESSERLTVKSVEFKKQEISLDKIRLNDVFQYADRIKWKRVMLPVHSSDLRDVVVRIEFEVVTGLRPFHVGTQAYFVEASLDLSQKPQNSLYVFSIEKTHALAGLYALKSFSKLRESSTNTL